MTAEKTFKAAHVRVLREALARIGNGSSGNPQKTAMQALTTYTDLIIGYCPHPDSANVKGTQVCLSCGKIVESVS